MKWKYEIFKFLTGEKNCFTKIKTHKRQIKKNIYIY